MQRQHSAITSQTNEDYHKATRTRKEGVSDMAEYNPLKEDAAKAEAIRRRYMEKGTTKLDQLQALDAKVKTPGTVLSSMLGIVGALVMGTGMSNIMVWNNMTVGLALGIPGLIMLCLAWPVYKAVTGSRRKKYAQQVMELSGAIIKEDAK